MFDSYFDEMKVGDRRVFDGITITESHIVGFAGVTGDHFGLHMDAEYAASTQFGQRVAHGLLVLSCGAGLIPLERGRVLAFLGMKDVRFRAPTFIGDTIHPEMEITAMEEKNQGGIVTIDETIKNQRNEAVITATIQVLVGRRPHSDNPGSVARTSTQP